MGNLSFQHSLSEPECDLLAAAGFQEDRDLTDLGAEKVHEELGKANEFLHIMESPPTLELTQQWLEQIGSGETSKNSHDFADTKKKQASAAVTTIAQTREKPVKPVAKASETRLISALARSQESSSETITADSRCYNYESDPDVQELLEQSPVALPIPAEKLADGQVPVDELPCAHLLNAAPGDLEVRVAPERKKIDTAGSTAPRSHHRKFIKVAKSGPDGEHTFDASRVRSLEHARAESIAESQSSRPAVTRDPQQQLLRAPLESTNRGKNPRSRHFIRGVLHDRPYLVAFGSLTFIVFQLSILATLISLSLYILANQFPDNFPEISLGVLVFPAILLVTTIAYLIMAAKVKCRVCGQKVLWPKRCHKHDKAHHIRFLGYILPLSLHALTYRWFNCTYCGTSLRIKK